MMANQGLAMYQRLGSEVGSTWLLALVSETANKAGQHRASVDTIRQALAAVTRTGEHCYEAELYRLRGELSLARSGVHNPDFGAQENQPSGIETPESKDTNPQSLTLNCQKEAEADFLKALDIARRQQAKSWELRAAMSLARLWRVQGKNAEAHKLLSDVYNWFTEGFDTKDLQEARTLLESLSL